MLSTEKDRQTSWFMFSAPRVVRVVFAIGVMLALIGARAASAQNPNDEPTYPTQVVADIPAPDAVIGGMAFDGSSLWCAGRGSRRIYQIDPATEKVLHEIRTPGGHAAGLDYADGKLWHVDGRTRKMYRIDPESGEVEAEHALKASDPTGIVVSDGKAYISDYVDGVTYVHDSKSGDLLSTKTACFKSIWGSSRDERYFYFVSSEGDEVFILEPERWQMVSSLPIVLEEASAAAVDGDCIWVASASDPVIRKYRIRGERSYVVRYWRERKSNRVLTYVNHSDQPWERLDLTEVLPIDMPNQEIHMERARFDPPADRVIRDEYDQRKALYTFKNVAPGDFAQVGYSIPLRFGQLRYVVLPDQVGTVDDIDDDFREMWTRDIEKAELDMSKPIVRQAAAEAVGDETNVFWMAMKIHDYVSHKVTYAFPGHKAVADTLASGLGICDDYARSMVAMCRLNGIPARHLCGNNHVSVEIWMPGPDVWFPIDITADRYLGRKTLWAERHFWGRSDRIINHMTTRPDYFFWHPDIKPEEADDYGWENYEYVADGWDNCGPIYSGYGSAPTLKDGTLHFEIYPPFDPEGDEPVRYLGYLSRSRDARGEGAPDFATDENPADVSVEAPEGAGELFLRIVPEDAHGAACPDVRTESRFNVRVRVGD